MLKSLRTRRVWKDVDVRARTWPAWYSLIGNHATDKLGNRARAAREAPIDRNVEKAIGFQGCGKCARAEMFLIDEKVMCFFFRRLY